MQTPLSGEYECKRLDTPFYGVYYGQLALPIEPDSITYLEHENFDDCIIINHENGQEKSDAHAAAQTPTYPHASHSRHDLFLSGAATYLQHGAPPPP